VRARSALKVMVRVISKVSGLGILGLGSGLLTILFIYFFDFRLCQALEDSRFIRKI
jgi:hypothetical protein